MIDGKRVVGQYAHYKCDEGYELNGDIRRECQLSDLNGTWSGNEPICKIVGKRRIEPKEVKRVINLSES